MSKLIEDVVDRGVDFEEILEQMKRDVARVEKKSGGGYFKRFHNVEMLRKLSGGLFDIPYPANQQG